MTKSNKGGDATSWKRSARGVDREDNSEWFRTFDPKADRYQYGPPAEGVFQRVMEDDGPAVEGDDV